MKKFFAVGLVAAIGAMALASAAALGGGTVSGSSLGAVDAVVAACDTDGISVGYTTSYLDTVGYVVDSVDVGDLAPACDGLNISVQLTSDGTGTILAGGDGSTIVAASPGTTNVAVSGDPLAEDVQDVHVLISD